jgi:hypothetical protein
MMPPCFAARLARRAIARSAILALCATRAAAQQSPGADSATQPWQAGVYVGVAHDSPTNGQLGVTPGRDHVFVGLQAFTPILRVGSLRISYGAQLLPLVIVRGRSAPIGYTGATNPDGTIPGPDVAYAAGLSPFGFDLTLPLTDRVHTYGAAAAGGLIFTRPFPVPEARRLNFTLEYGGGLLVRTGRAQWLRLGYKYHHLSNAYTAQINPGLDAHVLYAGYEWAIRLPR